MADDHLSYLHEQLQRKERGEPWDEEWVRREIEGYSTGLAGDLPYLMRMVISGAAVCVLLVVGYFVGVHGRPRGHRDLRVLLGMLIVGFGWMVYAFVCTRRLGRNRRERQSQNPIPNESAGSSQR